MFDTKNCTKKRYFSIKLYSGDKSIVINVEPPRLKTLKKLISITKNEELNADEFKYMVTSFLAKNKEHRKIDEYIDELDIDQLKAVYEAFMEWLGESKSEKN